jgi:transposase InsO family protein
MPNETWQSDFTHYRLTQHDGSGGADVEIVTWLDDCSRYALSVTAHVRVTGPIVLATFRATLTQHGIPASTLTDNGMVYTARFAGGRGGRNGFEHELRQLHVTQKNSRPNHPTTCGKVERFQQTMKNWLRARPVQPSTITELQALLDTFRDEYNQPRPHRSLPHRATPAALYDTIPKALRQRPPPPHRHRPNPRPNPRHPARPGPRRPQCQRRHRRAHPRAEHRSHQGLPAHRSTQRTHPTTTAEIATAGPKLRVRLSPMS